MTAKHRQKLWITVVAATALLMSTVLSGCRANETESAVEAPIAVRVQMPELRTLERRMSYVGTVFAGREVNVIARVQGTVAEIAPAEGESFSEGTVLARLESPEIEASVQRLEAELEYWSRRHETDKRLVERGAIPAEQADSSERAYRSARAGLAEAQAQLDKTVVRAPFAGTMLDRLVEPGQPLMPGQPLVLIGDRSREIRVEVVEEDLERGVRAGTEAVLRLPGSVAVESTVRKISSVSSGPARSFTVTIPLPQGVEPTPRKGTSVRTEFILERSEATVAVPVRAIAGRDRNPYLFVISDGVARKHEVTLGVTEGGWVAAGFAWNGVDPVAITNVSGLRDGARVFAVPAEGAE